jgi:hypothetical protein
LIAAPAVAGATSSAATSTENGSLSLILTPKVPSHRS